MTTLLNERLCAEMPEDVVVFAIGMRINRFWKVWKWFPVFLEMPDMLKEQEADPSIGLLSTRFMFGFRNIGVLQHWRSTEDLQVHAHGPGRLHLAAWKRFNARIGTSGDVGIWHETYAVPAGRMESIFVNMPAYGLGLAGKLFPAKGDRASATKRHRRRVHEPSERYRLHHTILWWPFPAFLSPLKIDLPRGRAGPSFFNSPERI